MTTIINVEVDEAGNVTVESFDIDTKAKVE